LINSTSIPVLEQVLHFAQARHNVLAGNIANLDVPGYQVRDLSVDTFQQRLREAVQARNEPQEQFTPGVLTSSPDDAMRDVRDSIKSILYHDRSNVGLEQQVAEMVKNQSMHNMAIAIMTNQFRLLQAAVSERV
jgi:flagellar basal-body rod protein FlgB